MSNQNPIVPVRIDPVLKKQFQAAQHADGFKCLATWIKAQCERRLDELGPINIEHKDS